MSQIENVFLINMVSRLRFTCALTYVVSLEGEIGFVHYAEAMPVVSTF